MARPTTPTPRRGRRRRLRGTVRHPGATSGAGRRRADRPHRPPPVPAAALPGGDRHPLRGRRSPGHCVRCCAKQANARVLVGEVTDIDLAGGPSPRRPSADDRSRPTTASSSPPEPALLLRPRRLRRACAGTEVDRRRTRDPCPDLRGLRAGRGRPERRASGVDTSPSWSSVEVPPASRWPGRSATWPDAACAGTSPHRPARGRRSCCSRLAPSCCPPTAGACH